MWCWSCLPSSRMLKSMIKAQIPEPRFPCLKTVCPDSLILVHHHCCCIHDSVLSKTAPICEQYLSGVGKGTSIRSSQAISLIYWIRSSIQDGDPQGHHREGDWQSSGLTSCGSKCRAEMVLGQLGHRYPSLMWPPPENHNRMWGCQNVCFLKVIS